MDVITWKWLLAKMKTHAANGNDACGLQTRSANSRALHWLENYVSKNLCADAAIEARKIIGELRAVRVGAAVDQLLALIGEIAKSDHGLQEIHRAKIRMGQRAETNGEEIVNPNETHLQMHAEETGT